MDIREALKEGIARLRAAQIPSHTLAAELLLMHTLGCDRAWIYTCSEAALDHVSAEKYFALVARRVAGEPTQYLTGKQEFWGLEFEVTPAVLIPRPETEHVVEVSLARLGRRALSANPETGAPSPPLRVADVGTGSGCLAIALARELPHAKIFATDISAAALEVARRNATRHGVSERIHLIQSNLLSSLLSEESLALSQESPITNHESHLFDLIVSNPPYVARGEAGALPREVRDHEPEEALFGGPTGTEIYARLIEQAGALLRPNGVVVLEIGHGATESVRAMIAAEAGWTNLTVTNDLAGIPRVLAAERG